MPLQYTVKREDFTPAAVLWARCAHHPTQQLAAWGMHADGRREWMEDTTGWHTEVVSSYVPSDEDRRRTPAFIGFPVAQPGPGQDDHFRHIVECPRPSCDYRAELEQKGREAVTDLLRVMVEHGVAHRVIELNAFLRDPRAEHRVVESM